MFKKFVVLSSFAFTLQVHSETFGGREFPSEVTVGEHKLTINGGGVREVERFGMRFKVSSVVMYTAAKTTSAEDVMSLKTPVVITSNYLRSVGGKDITESLESNFSENCVVNCGESKKALKVLSLKYPDMRDKDTSEYRIFDNKVEYDVKGRTVLKGTIEGADFAKNFIAMYFGRKTPKALKEILLGLKK